MRYVSQFCLGFFAIFHIFRWTSSKQENIRVRWRHKDKNTYNISMHITACVTFRSHTLLNLINFLATLTFVRLFSALVFFFLMKN